jgi:uroporphyrinogen-III decarboxylase
MMATDTNGIDTLDPPPLGTVKLEEAKEILSGKTFIKGNIDPVNTLLYGNQEKVREDVKRRIAIGKPGGGYILSSACSVAPHTPPENIEVLAQLAEEFGKYD